MQLVVLYSKEFTLTPPPKHSWPITKYISYEYSLKANSHAWEAEWGEGALAQLGTKEFFTRSTV